jgi:hypothetical protein
MEAAIDTLKWYQHSKKAVQANRNMETTNDLVTFDPVDQVSVQATGMTPWLCLLLSGQSLLKCPNLLYRKQRLVSGLGRGLVDSWLCCFLAGTATVNYLGTAQMIRIGVEIQNQKVNAIIDTGAQVTSLNDKKNYQLPSKPYTERETQLHTVGREMSMKCRDMQPMCFSILGFEFRQPLHDRTGWYCYPIHWRFSFSTKSYIHGFSI